MNNNKEIEPLQFFSGYPGKPKDIMMKPKDGCYPMLATRNLVLFPTAIAPILVGRDASINLVKTLNDDLEKIFVIFTQTKEQTNNPDVATLYKTGVFAHLLQPVDYNGEDDTCTIFVQPIAKCQLNSIVSKKPFYQADVSYVEEDTVGKKDSEMKTILEILHDTTSKYISTNQDIPDGVLSALGMLTNDYIYVNFISNNLPFTPKEKIQILECSTLKDRIYHLIKFEKRGIKLLELKNQINNRTHEDISAQQREFFLQQQMKNIKDELDGEEGNSDKKELEEKAKKCKWSAETAKLFKRELDKFDSLNTQNPEYNIQYNYLNTMVSLPWGNETKDDLDLDHAQKVLDKDHYGMEKVKERILEFISVVSLKGLSKSPILCLYGPPGVGKTSLGKSIASALKRKYIRMSLGGLHDEAEIRGHRRTYIGAMPGRIIKNIQKAGSDNPVFILDEIDKVVKGSVNGDPSSALLEVLDPEQNKTFHDNFLDVDYDLSHILFIATANDLSTIPGPLLDRMEIIELSGYITEEKIEIARRHLVKREMNNTGLDTLENKPKFTKPALEKIIESYTRESGVRQLDKEINKAFRKIAFLYKRDGKLPSEKITPDDLKELLGVAPFYRDIYQGNDYAGVVTGLAWTCVGGEILFIETSLNKGKGEKLTLTGNLGDVMKESAVIALQYVKAHIDTLGVDYRIFDNWNIHIHVPEGATPKDGPSAGITIATSIASAITQRKLRKNVAMTGEITLRGKVLPVGGIKEKILAAKRAGITDIVMCKDNQKDIEEIPSKYLEGVEFHYVENVQDVWDFALTDELVDNPVKFTIEENTK